MTGKLAAFVCWRGPLATTVVPDRGSPRRRKHLYMPFDPSGRGGKETAPDVGASIQVLVPHAINQSAVRSTLGTSPSTSAVLSYRPIQSLLCAFGLAKSHTTPSPISYSGLRDCTMVLRMALHDPFFPLPTHSQFGSLKQFFLLECWGQDSSAPSKSADSVPSSLPPGEPSPTGGQETGLRFLLLFLPSDRAIGPMAPPSS
mmetsp:Transcript_35600/g.106227  ORF Transcript_35600/g.106227 Transcript_35600/m.106227 type:complete len:201 (+) Transcript_35600:2234-2836(+)